MIFGAKKVFIIPSIILDMATINRASGFAQPASSCVLLNIVSMIKIKANSHSVCLIIPNIKFVRNSISRITLALIMLDQTFA